MTTSAPNATGKSGGSVRGKVLAALGVLATVVTIVGGIYAMVDKGPPPSTTTYNTEYHAPPGVVDSPVYATVMAPTGFASVYTYTYPMASSATISQVPTGASVQLRCSAQGDTVTGDYGTSSLWYDTNYGYIPDAYLNTGTTQAQRPSCT